METIDDVTYDIVVNSVMYILVTVAIIMFIYYMIKKR